MKIKPQQVFALALMGTQCAWAAEGVKAGLFNSSLAPLLAIVTENRVVIAQSAVNEKSQGLAINVITMCEDVGGYIDLDPAAYVLSHIGYKESANTGQWTPTLDLERDISFLASELPKHGQVGYGLRGGSKSYGYSVTDRDADGLPTYVGNDRIVFLVNVKGQTYKLVVNLFVQAGAGDTQEQICKSIKFSESLNRVPAASLANWIAGSVKAVKGVRLELASPDAAPANDLRQLGLAGLDA